MTQEKVLIFDVGRVLVNFSFDPFEKFLIKNGAAISTRDEFYEATSLFKYESGEITSEEFVQSVKTLLTSEVDSATIIKEWQNIFNPIHEMIEFCKICGETTNTFILSNTNELHWEHLDREYKVNSLTKNAYTSHKLGVMKPHKEIYRLVENSIGIDSPDILFIDDLVENIEAAKSIGWNTILHKNFLETKKIVTDFIKV